MLHRRTSLFILLVAWACLAILAFALFVIGLTFFLADLSMGDLARIILNVGLACIHIFGVIMAVFIGILLIGFLYIIKKGALEWR